MAIRILKKPERPAKPVAPPARPSRAKPDSLSTAPAAAPVVEQPSAPGFAPSTAMGPPSFLAPPDNVNWTDPNRDTTKEDSLGNKKTDLGTFGPKGDSLPPDVQTDAQRQAAADAKEAKLQQGMASTVAVDSLGEQKGRFAVTPQGYDKQGAKIPDEVDRSQVVEAQPVFTGPRGQGAPQDTFHGARPAKK
jgi:hypothetical protein